MRAYLIGGIGAALLALLLTTVWLYQSRASLLEQRTELRRQVEIGAQLLERTQAAREVADSAARKELARARAAEAQIRLILQAGSTQTPQGGDDVDNENDCGTDPVGCALDWLRNRRQP